MKEAIITFRKCEHADVDYLLWLRKVTMDQHLLNSGILLSEQENQDRILFEFDNAKLILVNDVKVGLVKILENENETEILQIQIAPEFQGKGIGSKIIRALIAKNIKRKLHLNVLKENRARFLYEKLGFVTVSETGDSFNMLYKTAT